MPVLDWLGNSPDFNPIENLWSTPKNKVAEKQSPCATELVTAITEIWGKEIGQDYCASLVKSRPSCCLAAVVREKVGHTKY